MYKKNVKSGKRLSSPDYAGITVATEACFGLSVKIKVEYFSLRARSFGINPE